MTELLQSPLRRTVKLSARTEYACLAMLELAAGAASPDPIRIRHISDEHGIPSRFLVQILLQLKNAGLVASTRGAAGGYRLARPADEITLAEVIAVTEGQSEQPQADSRTSPFAAVVDAALLEAAAAEREILEATTLGALLERARANSRDMYYI
jgi:Rrf2 family protein